MTDWIKDAEKGLKDRAEVVGERDRQLKWEPKEGDKLIGILKATKVLKTAFGAGLVMTIEDAVEKDADGKVAQWEVWAPTVMRSELWDVMPAIDGGIAIEKGGSSTSGKGYKFDLYYISAETPDVEYWKGVQREYEELEERLKRPAPATPQDGMEAPF